jgi:hypothetical protein
MVPGTVIEGTRRRSVPGRRLSAFDFDGWTPADELLAVTRAAEPDAGYEQRPIEAGLSDPL